MQKGLLTLLALVLGVPALLAQPLSSPPPLMSGGPISTQPVLAAPNFVSSPAAPQFYVNTEYLLWWVKSSPLPSSLLTTGPFDPNAFAATLIAGGIPPSPGGLSTAGTQNLFGANNAGFGALNGLRVTVGGNFDETFGIEGSGFVLERGSQSLNVTSDNNGNPLLTRPFVNPVTGHNTTLIIAAPSDTAGLVGGQTGAAYNTLTTRLWGAEANGTTALLVGPNFRVTGLAGFRYLDLQESLSMGSLSQPIVQPLPGALGNTTAAIGDTILVTDQFGTRNQFYGGQVGGRFQYIGDVFTVGLTTKIAVGATSEKATISGQSTLTGSVGTQTLPGGLYALPSNMGNHTSTDFSYVPELGLDLGVNVTSWARFTVGYTFLYWSRVARPGNQVNPVVDPAGVPTLGVYNPTAASNNPAFSMTRSDFWAQGVSLGLQLSF